MLNLDKKNLVNQVGKGLGLDKAPIKWNDEAKSNYINVIMGTFIQNFHQSLETIWTSK